MGKWSGTGYEAYTVGYYKEQLQNLFVEAFGSDFVLDDTLPQGVLIQRIAELLYNSDMDAVEVMSQLNLATASGIWLDFIGSFRGIARRAGSSQFCNIEITSNPAALPYTIPADTEFVSGGDTFKTQTQFIITTSPQTITVAYDGDGNSSVNIGDTMTCVLSQITNVEALSLVDGEPAEDDADYRTRLRTTYSVANNTMDWVEMKIAESPFVKTTGYGYNDSGSTVNQRPPHTSEWMAVPVEGVATAAFNSVVGTIIVNNKVPSSATYGNTTVTVQDLYGNNKQVSFTVPDKINLEIRITVQTPDDTGVFDLSNVEEQKRKAATYVNSLRIGNDVSMSRVLANFCSDPGYTVTGYYIREVGDDNWVQNADFVIGDREYAAVELQNITVGL